VFAYRYQTFGWREERRGGGEGRERKGTEGEYENDMQTSNNILLAPISCANVSAALMLMTLVDLGEYRGLYCAAPPPAASTAPWTCAEMHCFNSRNTYRYTGFITAPSAGLSLAVHHTHLYCTIDNGHSPYTSTAP
jgi:hypothetical protein